MDIGFYMRIPRPVEVLMQDPCPLGLPEILAVAHMLCWVLADSEALPGKPVAHNLGLP